jgi:hypothetical protein
MDLQVTVNGTSLEHIKQLAKEVGESYFSGPFVIVPFNAEIIGPGLFDLTYFKATVTMKAIEQIGLRDDA